MDIEVYNGYRIYVDIRTGKLFRQIKLLTLNSFISHFVHLLGGEGIVIVACYFFHFIREHANLV